MNVNRRNGVEGCLGRGWDFSWTTRIEFNASWGKRTRIFINLTGKRFKGSLPANQLKGKLIYSFEGKVLRTLLIKSLFIIEYLWIDQ